MPPEYNDPEYKVIKKFVYKRMWGLGLWLDVLWMYVTSLELSYRGQKMYSLINSAISLENHINSLNSFKINVMRPLKIALPQIRTHHTLYIWLSNKCLPRISAHPSNKCSPLDPL